MQMREGLLTFDHAGRLEHTPEPDSALFVTNDNMFEIVTEDGERLIFDRAELHAATAPIVASAQAA